MRVTALALPYGAGYATAPSGRPSLYANLVVSTSTIQANVNAAAAGKSIPELNREAALRAGAPTLENLDAAKREMPGGLSPQEEGLYRRHLANVVGPGGITQPDGKRSTLELDSLIEHV